MKVAYGLVRFGFYPIYENSVLSPSKYKSLTRPNSGFESLSVISVSYQQGLQVCHSWWRFVVYVVVWGLMDMLTYIASTFVCVCRYTKVWTFLWFTCIKIQLFKFVTVTKRTLDAKTEKLSWKKLLSECFSVFTESWLLLLVSMSTLSKV